MEPKTGLHIAELQGDAYLAANSETREPEIVMTVTDGNGDAILLTMAITAGRKIRRNLNRTLFDLGSMNPSASDAQ